MKNFKLNLNKIKSELIKLGRHVVKDQPKADAAVIKAAKADDKDSPYVKGRMAWDELYGSKVIQIENNYRLIACLCAVIFGLGFACWHIASQSKVKPYIVQVTSNGQVITGMQAKSFDQNNIPQSVVEGALYQFIVDARGITGDADVDQNNIYAAQALTTKNAFSTLSHYYQQNNPLIVGKTEKVNIQVIYEIPRTQNTYEVAWQETATTLDGQQISQKNFIADMTYKLGEVKDIRYNPLGLYITDLTWTEQI